MAYSIWYVVHSRFHKLRILEKGFKAAFKGFGLLIKGSDCCGDVKQV